MKQSQTKELTNQLSAAFSALIQHLWIKHRPSKNSLISSFWYLIFLIANGSVIAGLLFLFIKSDPDMAKLIISTQQESSTSSFWGIVSAIGSLLAGLGTVGLLAFGWVKGTEWMKQERFRRELDDLNKLLQDAYKIKEYSAQAKGVAKGSMQKTTDNMLKMSMVINLIEVCDTQIHEINNRWRLSLTKLNKPELTDLSQNHNFEAINEELSTHISEWNEQVTTVTNKLT